MTGNLRCRLRSLRYFVSVIGPSFSHHCRFDTLPASIEQTFVRIQHHSHQTDVQGTAVWHLNVSTQRFHLIFSAYLRPWISTLEFEPIASGSFFDDNHMLTEWESGKTVLVTPPPPQSDASAFDTSSVLVVILDYRREILFPTSKIEFVGFQWIN